MKQTFYEFHNACFQDGSTLMHIAAQAGHPDTALVFLKKGVPLHMPNKVNKCVPLEHVDLKRIALLTL